MFDRIIRHRSVFIFILALFAFFVLSGVALVLLGANVYRQTTDEAGENRQIRTSLSYITEKVHQADHQNGVSVLQQAGISALVLTSEYHQTEYVTYIYCHDGKLKELFTRKDLPFTPDAGSTITAVRQFTITKNASLLRLSVTDLSGQDHTLYIHPNAKGAESS